MKQVIFALIGGLLSQCLLAQANPETLRKNPFILGFIEEIQSKELSEKRVLNIYLPDGYNKKDTTKYPVIYLLDGSADEDFIHVAGLVQFLNFPWVNILPKTIVVGIANTDRKKDFTFTPTDKALQKEYPTSGHSGKFISFIEKELQPYIESNYPANRSKTIIGQSLGGLLATEILLKKPQLFSNYIIISPSLWWNSESLLSLQPPVKNYSTKQHTIVYVALGKEGAVMENDAKKLVDLLMKDSTKHMQVSFEYFSNETHATILHRAVYNAFEKFNKLSKKTKNP